MDPQMRQMLMGQIAKLHRMPDLAKALEEYQPQPDPFQEKMKELEIQEKEVNIFERQTRAEENKVDMVNKQTQAMLNRAKTRQLLSDTDLKDLDFTQTADGTKHAQDMEKQESQQRSAERQKTQDNITKLHTAKKKETSKK
jgi:hypothetical protein